MYRIVLLSLNYCRFSPVERIHFFSVAFIYFFESFGVQLFCCCRARNVALTNFSLPQVECDGVITGFRPFSFFFSFLLYESSFRTLGFCGFSDCTDGTFTLSFLFLDFFLKR